MGAPVYIQIHDEISEAIEAGRWIPGDKIPAERELAEQFGVSRMTLRQAVMMLVDEGVLERRVGSGTYVAERKVQEQLNGVTSFTEMMAAAGKVATSRTISFHIGKASNSEQEQLQLGEDGQVLRMERVRSVTAAAVTVCCARPIFRPRSSESVRYSEFVRLSRAKPSTKVAGIEATSNAIGSSLP